MNERIKYMLMTAEDSYGHGRHHSNWTQEDRVKLLDKWHRKGIEYKATSQSEQNDI
jgi:hypothetical protein